MESRRNDGLAHGLGARCNRRDVVRWLGASAVAAVGMPSSTERVDASPAPHSGESIERRLPTGLVDVSHDTERVAGLGLAAAAVLVAGKLIRDKERDPEL